MWVSSRLPQNKLKAIYTFIFFFKIKISIPMYAYIIKKNIDVLWIKCEVEDLCLFILYVYSDWWEKEK